MVRNSKAERKLGHIPCLALSLNRYRRVTLLICLATDSGDTEGCSFSGTSALWGNKRHVNQRAAV